MFHNETRGLARLPPPKSAVTRESVRFTCGAGQYATPGVSVPSDPFALFWSQNIPSSHGAQSLPLPSNGMMAFEGHGTPQVWSSSGAFVRRDFPAETYVQVKRHVNHMLEHPNEKTLKYQVDCVLEHSRRFIVLTKWKTLSLWGRFRAFVCRYLKVWWKSLMAIIETAKKIRLVVREARLVTQPPELV